ncbi:88ea54c7-5fcc-419d-b1c4-67de1da2a136 [Thermothielavioides terrestris]|nr:88ea54c7-5fcc-419d-b1c4-67de1da2a136 [Thermothielavioides terrestris]
MAKWVSR